MPVTKAVARLNADLAHLANANRLLHTDQHQYNVDVTRQRAALGAIDAQKRKITDQFVGATQPSGANELKLLNQLFALGVKRQATLDAFGATLVKDKKTISADAGSINAWKAAGKKHLLPAEYTLGLAETNKDRAALGLGGVNKVVRPPAPKPVVYVVKPGDTMGGIAKSHGMTLSGLIAANPQVRNPDNIEVGQRLNLKPGAAVAPVVTTGTSAADKARAKVVQYALAQANDPNVGYSQDLDKRFGQSQGGGRRYYDCSGLVVSAYKTIGVTLPANDTRSMWATRSAWAKEIPKSTGQMKAGDLVLINSNSPVEHHVLIYVGAGKCVAASTDGIEFSRQVRYGDSAQSYFDTYGSRCVVLRPNV